MARISLTTLRLSPAALVVGLALTGINIGGIALDQHAHAERSKAASTERHRFELELQKMSTQVALLTAILRRCAR